VLPTSSEDVAKTFRESVDFAGLLQNGVLSRELSADTHAEAEQPSGETGETDEAPPEDRNSDLGAGSFSSAIPIGMQRYTIPLDTNGRLASIDIPLPVAAADLRKVKKWAEYMSSLSEDEE
jgi:hypothetical protein